MSNFANGFYESVIKKPINLGFSFQMPDSWDNIPLIVYLHGAGENGTDPKKYNGAIKDLCPIKKPEFAILSPICSIGEIWEPDAIVGLIRGYILKNYPIDPSRIYLTGFSMGGRGVWDCATEYPDMFAAVSALSGFSCYLRAAKMKNVPSWTFHGKQDHVVPFEESWKMVNALMESDGVKPRFTVMDDVGHGTVGVYRSQTFYKWLLSHKKG
jgi:predicted peptidase